MDNNVYWIGLGIIGMFAIGAIFWMVFLRVDKAIIKRQKRKSK